MLFYGGGLGEVKGGKREMIVEEMDIMGRVVGVVGYDGGYIGLGEDGVDRGVSEKFGVKYINGRGM